MAPVVTRSVHFADLAPLIDAVFDEDDEVVPDSEEEREERAVSEALQMEPKQKQMAIISPKDLKNVSGHHATEKAHKARKPDTEKRRLSDAVAERPLVRKRSINESDHGVEARQRMRPSTQASPRATAPSLSPPIKRGQLSGSMSSPSTPRRLKVEVFIPSPAHKNTCNQETRNSGTSKRTRFTSQETSKLNDGRGDIAVVDWRGRLVRTMTQRELDATR